MKKILTFVLVLSMLLTSVAMLSSCSDTIEGVKVIDIKLTEEQYAFAVQKGDTELLNSLN